MKKILLFTFIGLICTFGGIVSLYIYLNGLKTTNNIVLLIISIILLLPGIFVLYKAGSMNAFQSNIESIDDIGKKKGSLIEKNSQLASEWKKTVEQADKLKLIGLRADEENKNS